ncbi:MAG: tetratricopeptide repeat protein [Chitinophagaceae bacterium]|nr:MAG: tetratricopeptide repeat protein [Chitinophagaceae bacterium]
MKDNSYQEDREQMKELLRQYEDLRTGRKHSFIDEESFERIISYFEERDEAPKALEAANCAIEQYPFSSGLLISKADTLIANRRYAEALEVLDQAALFDSNDINLYILRTDAFLALDRQEEAVEILSEALDRFEGEEKVELLFELADVYDDYEEFDKVFDCLKMILEQEPTNEEALYKICFWTDFTGRNEESIRLHMKVIDDFPYSELAWFNLAAAYQGLKLYEKAIDAYQYAIVIEEKFDYAYRNMGDAYIRLRKYREAIEALEKVTELSKPEVVIYEAMGHCYDRLKNFAQARFYYRKASHLNQEDSKLLYKIACTYYNENNYTAAVKQLDNALKMQRLQPEYNLLMGECKMEQGYTREAIQYFSQVVRSRPRNKGGWEALIRCLIQQDLAQDALEQCHAALRATGQKPVFLYYLAAALLKAGMAKEGVLQLEAALTAAPRMLKKFVELDSSWLSNRQVVEVIARFKKKGS